MIGFHDRARGNVFRSHADDLLTVPPILQSPMMPVTRVYFSLQKCRIPSEVSSLSKLDRKTFWIEKLNSWAIKTSKGALV
jgi:hypothetical protein